MNTLFQEEHNHSESCITFKVLRRTKKVEIHLAKERCGLAFSSTNLGHIFGRNNAKEFGVMFRQRGPHKRKFAYDIFRIQSLRIYTYLIEYKIVDNTKVPLLRCFLFVSKLKAGEISTTRQCSNYQLFINLQIIPPLISFLHSIYTDLRNTSGEKMPFASAGVTHLVLMFKKAANSHF